MAGAIAPPMYPPELSLETVFVSNGLGYLTPMPGLGLPSGRFIYHRLAAYLGASSRWRKSHTFTNGLRTRVSRAAAIVNILPFRNSMR